MSWDIIILKFTQSYSTADAVPDDAPTLPLGTQAEVHQAISNIFPGTDWSDPEWGVFDSEIGSIEFNLSSDDPIEDLMLHVRASNGIVPPIVALCRQQHWLAIDCSTGDFLEQADDPTAGLENWQAFRDSVIDQS